MIDPSSTIEPANLGASTNHKWSPMRLAVMGSVVFHIVLIAVLLAWYFPRQSPTDNRALADGNTKADSETPVATQKPVSEPDGQQSHSAEQSASRALPPADNIPQEQIESSLRSAIEGTATASEERKLSELRQNVQRLERVASESSIAEVGEAIRSATALEDRASVPATDTVGGAFDFDSAQFHDVSRESDQEGKWVYRSILLDAKGRTVEVELTDSEGKTAYETMQMVKASPFAETVYRSMVMPMLDKLIPKTVPTLQSPAMPTPNQSAEAEEMP